MKSRIVPGPNARPPALKEVSSRVHTELVPFLQIVKTVLEFGHWDHVQSPLDGSLQVFNTLEPVTTDLRLHVREGPEVARREVGTVLRVGPDELLNTPEVVHGWVRLVGRGVILEQIKSLSPSKVWPFPPQCLSHLAHRIHVNITVHCPTIKEVGGDYSMAVKKQNEEGFLLRA